MWRGKIIYFSAMDPYGYFSYSCSHLTWSFRIAIHSTGMAGVPGTASAIFSAVKDVGANVIMISQVIILPLPLPSGIVRFKYYFCFLVMDLTI